jgi:dienelactone hydrolase
MGGAVAVVAAARLRPAALVDVSGERDTAGLTPGIRANAGAAARDVTAPALFVVARQDRYVPVGDIRALDERAASEASASSSYPRGPAGACSSASKPTGRRWRHRPAASIRRHAG